MLKQKIIIILRKIRLLHFAEKIRSIYHFYKYRNLLKTFKKNKKYSNFLLPPYVIAYDAFAGFDPYHYINQGKKHASFVSSLIEKYKGKNVKSIYEWGCGPMRVLRHLPIFFDIKKTSFFGSDFNYKSVSWAKKNFKDINVSLNSLSPPLPYNNESFDVVYCISVFTHLSENVSKQYISDIYRILKKDGIFISTFHGNMNSKVLTKKELYDFEKGYFVERGSVVEGSRIYASYHPDLFIRKNFSQFRILEKIESKTQSDFEQDWWVFKK